MFLPDHKKLKELVQLETQFNNRIDFHNSTEQIFADLAQDAAFFDEVVRRNLSDPNFLKQEWSLYNIPSLYIGETADIVLKYHVFVPLKEHVAGFGASAIHHHSNYILSTTAVLGSGYETFMFDKTFKVDNKTNEVDLKITRYYTEKQNTFSIVDAWEPHVVFNPSLLSATLLMWTTDKKRSTDALRHNPLLKSIKTPIRKAIGLLGLESKFGVTSKTEQYYAQGDKFYAVDEDEFFAPTRAAKGPDVNSYSMQAIFAFIQRMGWRNTAFLNSMKQNPDVPKYYYPFIDKLIADEPIADVYAKDQINIPKGQFYKQDILNAHKKLWGDFKP